MIIMCKVSTIYLFVTWTLERRSVHVLMSMVLMAGAVPSAVAIPVVRFLEVLLLVIYMKTK